MKRLLRPGLFALLFLMLLLWVAFRPHEVARDFWKINQMQQSKAPEDLPGIAQAYARLAERIPWRSDFWEQAGSYALRAGDLEASIRYLSNAKSRDALSSEGFEQLGAAYQQAGHANAAVQAWEEAVQARQASPSIYRQLYQAYLENKNYAAATQHLQELSGLQPLDADLSYQLGLLLAALDPESALAHLAKSADLDAGLSASAQSVIDAIRTGLLADDPAYTLLSAGRALAAINEWQLAYLAFQQAIQARPDYAEAWAFLGEANQHLDQSDQEMSTLEILEKALRLDPNSLAANSTLGLYWRRQGVHEQALKYYQKATEISPNNPTLQVDYANALAHTGEYEKSLEVFQHAIELAPQNPAFYRHLAAFSLSYEYQVRQIALPAARQALLLQPDDPESLVTMGQVLVLLGDLATAERYLNTALQIEPNQASAHLQLGLLYILRGDRQAAFAKWTLVQSLAPGSPASDQAQRLLQNYFP